MEDGPQRDAKTCRFTDYSARFVAAEEGLELTICFFMRADRKERRLLEQEIDDALIKYYADNKFDPAAYVPLVNTLVLDIAAHWQTKLIV